MTVNPAAPFRLASTPAGAFHTPRALSVRAITPATNPHGGNAGRGFSWSEAGGVGGGGRGGGGGGGEPVTSPTAATMSAIDAGSLLSMMRNARRSAHAF